MILITGASGNMGRAVLDAMLVTGQPVRALYRSAADAAHAPAGVTTVLADFADKASLRAAFEGVDRIYLVCSPVRELVQLESNVIEVCLETGVRHIVLNSALGAADYPKSFPSWHRAVEDKLIASGLACTILRPNTFLQNIPTYLAPSIRAQGVFYTSVGDALYSYLDVRDIAEVAVKALVSPEEHAGQIYELNGPEAVSYPELARRISKAAGRIVSCVNIPEGAQQQAMLGAGMPAWQVEALLDLQRYYTSGKGGEVTDTLPRLLGRDPITLDRFLVEFRDYFAPLNPPRA